MADSRPQQVPDTLGIWRMMLLYANRKSHFRVGDLEQKYCNSDTKKMSVQGQLKIGEHQAKCRALSICLREGGKSPDHGLNAHFLV